MSKCSFLWQIYKMLGKIYNNPKSGRLVSFYIHCSDWYMYSKPLLWLRTVYLISFILIKIGLQLSNSSRSTIMKRKFKQWWPTIAPIFTKRIITSHLILQLEFEKKHLFLPILSPYVDAIFDVSSTTLLTYCISSE